MARGLCKMGQRSLISIEGKKRVTENRFQRKILKQMDKNFNEETDFLPIW
jgi:hypothetical protein